MSKGRNLRRLIKDRLTSGQDELQRVRGRLMEVAGHLGDGYDEILTAIVQVADLVELCERQLKIINARI